MATRKRVRGHDLMLFLNDKAIALATSCSIDLTSELDSASSKDDGLWNASEITGMSWTAATDGLMGTTDEAVTTDNSYDELLTAMLAATEVSIRVGVLDGTTTLSGVPEAGWVAPDVTYGGSAWITKLSLSGPDDGTATMSISLDGNGEFKKYEGTA